MNAREHFRAAYGDSRNFMSPRRLGYGWIVEGSLSYEISVGDGMRLPGEPEPPRPVYGVTLASAGGKKEHDLGRSFRSRDEARAYVRALKRERA